MGGLDHVFDDLFRRILTPRLLPTKVKSTLGLRQARGVVLYGPPGTGKTMVIFLLSFKLLAAIYEILLLVFSWLLVSCTCSLLAVSCSVEHFFHA